MTEYFKKKKVKPTFGEVAKKVVDNIVDALDEKSPTATELVRKAIDASPLKITYDILSKTIPDSLRVPFTPTSKTPETPKVTSDTPPKELKAPEAPTTVGAPKAEISARPVKPVTASPVTTPIKPGPKYLSVQPTSGEPKPAGEVKLEDPASLARNARLRLVSALRNKSDINPAVIDNIFENITDEAIERNIPVARDAIQANKAKGVLPENAEEKHPYLVDGLAMFYAASEEGKSKAARKARELAYSEGIIPESIDDSAGRFYKDYITKQKEKAVVPKIIPKESVPDPLAEFVKLSQSKTPYIDLTSDGKGLDAEFDPDPLEVAKLAEYSYSVFPPGRRVRISKDYDTKINGWILTDESYQNNQGLDIAVFRKNIEGKDCYIVSNVGTEKFFTTLGQQIEFATDWHNNIRQPLGASQDMKDSIEFAKKFVDEHPDANIIFVGHSKGGAEAAANAVATGKKAILFNPATVNLGAYGLNSKDYDSDMTAYIVDGEILNNIFWIISEPIDKLEIVNKEPRFQKILKSAFPIYWLIDSYIKHDMYSVVKNLGKDGKK